MAWTEKRGRKTLVIGSHKNRGIYAADGHAATSEEKT